MSYILILGAKSDIAKALAKKYAENNYNLYLGARAADELKEFATDLEIRHNIKAECVELDALNFSSHQEFFNSLEKKPYGIICVIGYLGSQETAQNSFAESKKIIDTNYTGPVSLINLVANDLEDRKEGFIIGISSVAGDRGRKSNFLYGSAKAGFTAYLSGLRNRLSGSKVHVLTVKPGFVATKMTEGLGLPKVLTAMPENVAQDIFKAQQKKQNILYTKWFWRWIMLGIKNIPEFQFKKMNL